jgi:dTDP-4-amino-4,6-dideoxygalactose transaminase
MTLDRYRGHSYSYDVIELGYNYRIDEIRSAIGLVQLEKLAQKNELRKELDARYREELRDVDFLDIPFEDRPHHSAHHIFPVLLPEGSNRMAFMASLRTKGLQTSIHYPPVHRFNYYSKLMKNKNVYLPWTEYVGSHQVTLPLFPSLTGTDIHYIVSSIQESSESLKSS